MINTTTIVSPNKGGTLRQIAHLAGRWQQPCFTGEDHEARHQQALAMIHEIAQWAMHPARGDKPPFSAE